MNEVAMIMPDLRWPGPIAMQEAMAPGAGIDCHWTVGDTFGQKQAIIGMSRQAERL